VFNYLDELLVSSVAISEHQLYLREVLGRLHSAGFTLDKAIVLGASEIKYLGHCHPEEEDSVEHFPRPHNLRSVWRSVGMVSFYAGFIAELSLRTPPPHQLKEQQSTLRDP
jgi:hypothetical protein